MGPKRKARQWVLASLYGLKPGCDPASVKAAGWTCNRAQIWKLHRNPVVTDSPGLFAACPPPVACTRSGPFPGVVVLEFSMRRLLFKTSIRAFRAIILKRFCLNEVPGFWVGALLLMSAPVQFLILSAFNEIRDDKILDFFAADMHFSGCRATGHRG
jgi:hypothetical protein